MPEARYEGLAKWYDEFVSGFAEPFASLLAARAADFGKPGDVVVDVGCGTGITFAALWARGLQPIGIDLAADQLRIARERAVGVLRADAAVLPIGDATVRIAVAAFVHTDIEDFSATVADIARVLRADGRFVYVGTHPCFIGPYVNRVAERDDGRVGLRPGYGDTHFVLGTSELKSKVGSRNPALGTFLRAFLDAGLRIESFEELDTQARPWVPEPEDQTVVPWNILLVAAKS
jgi:SAM-dependent methyltransferase